MKRTTIVGKARMLRRNCSTELVCLNWGPPTNICIYRCGSRKDFDWLANGLDPQLMYAQYQFLFFKRIIKQIWKIALVRITLQAYLTTDTTSNVSFTLMR